MALWISRVSNVGNQEEDGEQNLLSRPERAEMENKPTSAKKKRGYLPRLAVGVTDPGMSDQKK